MSWDRKRHGRRYYYRNRRLGEKTVKEYVGRGPEAEEEARQDAERRRQHHAERQQWDRLLDAMEQRRRLLEQLESSVDLLLNAMLLICGHYLHKGHEWRRRGGRDD